VSIEDPTINRKAEQEDTRKNTKKTTEAKFMFLGNIGRTMSIQSNKSDDSSSTSSDLTCSDISGKPHLYFLPERSEAKNAKRSFATKKLF